MRAPRTAGISVLPGLRAAGPGQRCAVSVVDGAVAPRSVVTMTLAADHRVSDGHAGALFLAEIGKLLQEPDKL